MTDMTNLLICLTQTKPDKGRTMPFCPVAEAGEGADGHGQGYIPCPLVRLPTGSLKFITIEGFNMTATGTTQSTGTTGLLTPMGWTRP